VEKWETFEQGQPRAPRFVLALSLRYRRNGAEEWEEGSMRNISRSGLFFTAQQAHSLHTRIELVWALPKVLRHEGPGMVRCQGEVVRSVPPATANDRPALAIRISAYEFVRTPAPPPTGVEVGK
jgi:hypothetical protein